MYDDAPRWSEQHFKDNELDQDIENDASVSKTELSAQDSLANNETHKTKRLERTLHNLMPQIAETRSNSPNRNTVESATHEELSTELHIAHEADPWDPREFEAPKEKKVETRENQETVYESEFDKRHEIKDDQTVFDLGSTATEVLLSRRASQLAAPVPIAKVLDEKRISERTRSETVNKHTSRVVQASQRYRMSLLAGVGGAVSFAILWAVITQVF